ncbi:hypothetical protein QUF70_18150, partial [Desulfobacterales bacterium HSG17]|nr:hypothetical protein [Desulfobacterales bacterium HSG17]
LFHPILTVPREVPVYVIFSKNGNAFDKFGSLWGKTLKKYYSENDIDERIKYHKEKSENIASQ